jgi:circadian clock protein KaiC
VFQGPEGVVTGSKRREQQLKALTGVEMREYAVGLNNKEIERKRRVLQAKIASLQEEFESMRDVLNKAYEREDYENQILAKKRAELLNSTPQKDGKNKRK